MGIYCGFEWKCDNWICVMVCNKYLEEGEDWVNIFLLEYKFFGNLFKDNLV